MCQAASLTSFFSFRWVAFALNLHSASAYGQHFAALSNMLGQLYPRPSGARSLSPLNLPNYASHQLFSRSIAVIPAPHTHHLSFSTSSSLCTTSLLLWVLCQQFHFLFSIPFSLLLSPLPLSVASFSYPHLSSNLVLTKNQAL